MGYIKTIKFEIYKKFPWFFDKSDGIREIQLKTGELIKFNCIVQGLQKCCSYCYESELVCSDCCAQM
jgi:hypothetical protein